MRQIFEIWKLSSEKQVLLLKGQPNPDHFWLELYENRTLVKTSKSIHHWEKELPPLMQTFDWKRYETIRVAPEFTTLVSEFRIKYGNYKRPNSRERILELYTRFLNNEEIDIKRTAFEFCVGTAEIKKDIRIIRDFLKRDHKSISYHRSDKIYKLSSEVLTATY